ncbi:hypothetical protein R3P38DRAFT_3068844, partial [Favolaschia claudopus]
MPRLWASLHIPTDFIIAKSETRTAAVEQWLSRAAASSLSVSVCDMEGHWGWFPSPDSNRKLEALVAVLARIVFTDMTRETVQALADIEPPHLRSFTFTGDLSLLPLLKSNLLTGQHLRAISVSSNSDLNFVPNLPIVWHQLTHLVLAQTRHDGESISISKMISLLGRCPQLVSLSVALGKEEALAGSVSSVSLPFLESFIVPFRRVIWSQSHLMYIADCVSMPKLRRFHFPILIENVGSELDSFSLASLASKYPLVQDLAIHLESLHTQALLETFQAFTALTQLVVDARVSVPYDAQGFWASCGTVRFLELLTDEDVCPRLQALEIFGILNLSKFVLDAFLSVRVHATCRLQRLSLAFDEIRMDPIIPRLSPSETRSYALEGLHISISPPPQPQIAYASSPWTGLPP